LNQYLEFMHSTVRITVLLTSHDLNYKNYRISSF